GCSSRPLRTVLEAFLVSTVIVAIAEIGDKTQLLALVLSARFRKPWVIVVGILAATLFNHALAGLLGEWIRASLSPQTLRLMLGVSFIAIAGWTLKPDTLERESHSLGTYGVFAVTLVAFFLAEIGDKTQIATVALAAKYTSLPAVVAGTTFGMLVANAPAVFLADRFAPKISFKVVRYIAAALFATMGIAVLVGSN
ncbi:MAG: Ca2+/H+ antiporter, family, partial [Betaproteobacteria bacterium]